jgi:signal transduction histidine kinase
MRLRTRLAVSYLLVILIGMALIAPLAWLAIERLYVNTESASLLAQAQLVAAALRSNPPPAGQVPYTQYSNTLPGIHTRVLDAQCAVVIDLSGSGPLSAPEAVALPQLAQNAAGVVTSSELMGRPEIAKAQLGQASTSIRSLDVAGGRRVLYAAVPVLSPEGSVSQIVYLATPLPDTQWGALPPALRWQFGGVILAAILLASSAGLLLARRISRPLAVLADAAQSIADGNLQQKVPEDPSISELAVVGQAFNHMTDSLRQSDQAKTAFISDVSHELRTPLTVIKGTIETLQDGALDDLAARGPFLDAMDRETDRLIRLVNDLLVLTRADAGSLNLRLHPLDLYELAKSRCQQFEKAAGQHQVSLSVLRGITGNDQGGREALAPLADADRIAQVLDNLLANALHYSPPGSTISLTVNTEQGRVICCVSDTGPGIPAQHLPFLFDRFYRVDPARERDRNQGGSGLGLSIVRSLVQAHGGEVSISSIENKGTSVTFWLPVSQA